MRSHPIHQAAVAAAAALLVAAPATATNGYFAHGYSVTQRAMGGAGTAYASDALIAAINPANVVLLPERLDVNAGLFSPRRWFRASERGPEAGPGVFSVDPGSVRSQREQFVIPAAAYSRPLGDGAAWGIALYGNGGMNTDYRGHSARLVPETNFENHCQGSLAGGAPVPGSQDNAGCGNGDSSASVDLIQLFLVPSYAQAVAPGVAVGLAPVIAVQRFQAVGLDAFAPFSNQRDKVTGNSYDFSYGAGFRAGVTVQALDWLDVGASWQSRILMTPFDDYAGLFADGGDFDIPSNWNLGVAFTLPLEQRVLLDFQRVNYSEVAAVGNPLDPNRFVNDCALPRFGGNPFPSPACLGAPDGPGFGWRDVSTVKLGYEIGFGPLKARAGYSRNRQPIPPDEVLFNILAPAVPQEHYTAGAAYRLSPAWVLEASFTYAANHPVTGKNPLSNAETTEQEIFQRAFTGTGDTDDAFKSDPQDQDLTLRMRQFEIMFGLGFEFGRAGD